MSMPCCGFIIMFDYYFDKRILKPRVIEVIRHPKMNRVGVICDCALATKKLITTEPQMIFEISARYLDIALV